MHCMHQYSVFIDLYSNTRVCTTKTNDDDVCHAHTSQCSNRINTLAKDALIFAT
jgi:hypothetical protein